jgi:thiol:disulfide interchange protein
MAAALTVISPRCRRRGEPALPRQPAAPSLTLVAALVALLGGLILNLMPVC